MNTESTKAFYNATAAAYAQNFLDELNHKPFDRYLLQRFARENKDKGKMGDLGCGPGHTTQYLSEQGVADIVGIDLSEKMIEQARMHFPTIPFETGDMLAFDKPDQHFGSLIGFYAIVHFQEEQLKNFFEEAHRVLKPGGQLLISFHIGDGMKRVDELLGVKASADFYFHEVDPMIERMTAAGFSIIDMMIRYPYVGKEFESKRGYLLATSQLTIGNRQ
ncbi:MAG: class I SAM-dependent methyltransferase [Chitinophagaceae bacterium]|nr:class I SAM-dependent methyltransferase [Chitinophagaceae bacterium]